jgi:hypothetical protein
MPTQNTVTPHWAHPSFPMTSPQNYVYRFEQGPRLNAGLALSIRKELA